ncbi:hypothetical protein TNCV_3217241 [Trichonephila clavipes]|nr:hypothetical protein TNCV_3217241 [Trichonephila clavipes]
MGPDFNPWRVGYPERGNIICITQYCTIHGKKGAIASRRLNFYLLVHGRYFIFLFYHPLETIGGVPLPPPGDVPFRGYRLPRGITDRNDLRPSGVAINACQQEDEAIRWWEWSN